MADDHGDIHLRLSAQDETLKEQTRILSGISTDLGLLRKDLLGNGQPGRIQLLESKVDDLDAHKNQAIGWAAAIGLVVTIGVAAFEYFKHAHP